MLYLPTPVLVGLIMDLKIHLPDYQTIQARVRVAWTELLTGMEQGDFKAGVVFEQIDTPDLELLQRFIRDQQNPSDSLKTQVKTYLYGKSEG